MTFADARTAIVPGQQIRLKDDYGAFPFVAPAGATGTVVENRLHAVDPVIVVVMDDFVEALAQYGNRLQIRGPEEAYHVEQEATVGRWGDAPPFDVIDPPTSPAETRRAALQTELDICESQHLGAQMSDNRYATSGRMDAAQAVIRKLQAAIASIA